MTQVATVADGLFAIDENGPGLIGSKCISCGTLYFPRALSCRNPACSNKLLERALLPKEGTLRSYTIQRYRPPALFRMDDWAPYAIGLVDLGEGVEVMGMLSGIAFDAITIDMPVVLVAEPLFTDIARGPVLTYKFAAVPA